MKINKTSSETIRLSNVNSFSNSIIKTSLTSRLGTVQAEIDQETKSKMDTEVVGNLSTGHTKPAIKQAMDQPLKYSLYLLPPFI